MKPKPHLEKILRLDMPFVDRLHQIRLDRNERVKAWPKGLWKKIQSVITPEVIMSYPELEPLYQKWAKHLRVDREQLLLTHGSDVGLKTLFEVYTGPGDETLSICPSYAMYPLYAQMTGAQPIEISFENDLTLPFEKILAAITNRTRIVCLANPNQPVERIYTAQEIEHLLKLSQEKDFFLLVDEAYHYFYPETFIDKITQHPNLIVSRTLSKAFGFAGLRIGLLIARPDVIVHLRKVKPISEINHVAAKLAEFFLDHMDIVEQHVREVNQGRGVILKRAAALGLSTHGTTGNSVLLKLATPEAVKRLVQNAKDQHYLIKGPFAHPASCHLRITLGSPKIMNGIMDLIEKELTS